MKKLTRLAGALIWTLGLAVVALPPAEAKPAKSKPAKSKPAKSKKEQKAEEERAALAPAVIKRAPRLRPKGLKFGMSPKQVAKVYDSAIDNDYRARMKDVEPGVQMDRLKHEIEQRKLFFRRTLAEFDGKPNNLDATPFAGEFSNNNGEALMKISRRGRTRHLFFINNKLWKTIDVYALKDGGKWGADFATATKSIQKRLKVEGRSLPVDEKAGRAHAEVDWADFKTHLRVMDWGKQLAIGFVDRSTEANLAKLRRNKPNKDDGVRAETKKFLRK